MQNKISDNRTETEKRGARDVNTLSSTGHMYSHFKRNGLPYIVTSVFFVVFFITGLGCIGSDNLSDYPFGADTPYYLEIFKPDAEVNQVVYAKHPLIVGMGTLFARIPLNLNPKVQCMLFFSLISALNIYFAFKLFLLFYSFPNAFWSTLIYGFSGSIWFFSSFPESYTLTMLLVTLYLYVFVKHLDAKESIKPAILLMCILALGTLNEIIFPLIFIIPVMYYNKRLITDRRLLLMQLLQVSVAGIAVIAVLAILFDNIGSFYIGRAEWFLQQNSTHKILDVGLDTFLFNIGFPTHSVTAESGLLLNKGYIGFFEHTLAAYFDHIQGIVFLIIHLFMAAMVAVSIRFHWRWLIAGGLFILLRTAIVYQFNAFEAILYTAPLSIVLVLIITMSAVEKLKSRSSFVLMAYAISIFATNVHFFWNQIHA